MLKKKTLVILVIVIFTLIFVLGRKNIEGYYPQFMQNYCPDCGRRGRYHCSKCVNCGYCVTWDGRSECVPGDKNGPYFRSDCHVWEHGEPLVHRYLPEQMNRFRYLPVRSYYNSNYYY